MRRWSAWVAAACCAALFAPLTWPLLTGRIFVRGDIGGYHVPMRYLYQQALHARELLLWTPAVFAGYYLHGEGQVGMLHPLHLLLYSTLPLHFAFNLEMLSNYAGAFAGMFWLLRRLRLATAAVLFGSMLFAFSGFQLLHLQHVNVVAIVAHIPWVLASAHLLATGESGRARAAGFAGVAIVLASTVLLGFPQAVWWNLLALAAFTPLFAPESHRLQAFAIAGAAAVIGILLGGVQLVPTIDMVAHSVRARSSRDFALMYSLHPWNVMQLWSPYVFTHTAYSPTDYLEPHELGIYSGAVLTIAPLWLWVRRDAIAPCRRILLVGAGAFAALMLLLALGRFGRLEILLTYVPGIGLLRAPARYIVLVQFVLIVFAAIAFDDLMRYQHEGPLLARRDLSVVSAVAIASVLTPLLVNTRVLPVRAGLPLATPSAAAVGSLFVGSVTAAMLLAGRRVAWALPLLIVLTSADLWTWGIRPVLAEPPQKIAWLTGGIPAPPAPKSARFVTPEGWVNRLLLKGYWLAGGYVGLYPATTLEGREFQQLAGASWNISRFGNYTRLPDAAPRARVVVPASSGDGTADVLADTPGRLVVDVSTPTTGVLAITERFHEGWSAKVDGRVVPTTKVASDFVGVPVEPGRHQVELTFAPASLRWGAVMSAVGLLGLIVGIYMMVRSDAGTLSSDAVSIEI